jgi:outer membrane protein OmpA-like peptidoglycan-associated protein
MLSSAFGAPSAFAEEPLPRLYVGLGGGANLVLTDWDVDVVNAEMRPVSAESSPLLVAHLGMDLASWLSLEAGAALLPVSAGDTDLTVVQLQVSARFPFTRGGVEPYALVGAGAYLSPGGYRGADEDPEVHYGAGVTLSATDWLDVRFEARHVMSDGVESTLSHALALTAGVDFVLWAARDEEAPPPDRDGDGVIDAADACPDAAGSRKLAGCPDRDGDGIADASDACPDQQGPAPDGCPAVAVVPEPEPAPEPEPKPDPKPEPKPDPKPDPKPEPKPDTDPLGPLLEPLPFDSASTDLSPSARATLDRIAAVMREHPDIRVQIEGHADATGESALNDALSRSRAERVRDLLVERGVAATRLVVRGYGENRPIADNGTAQGRAKNRRVSISIIER